MISRRRSDSVHSLHQPSMSFREKHSVHEVFTTAHEADGAGSVSFDPAFLEIWVANSSIDGSSHAPFTFDREIALPAGAGQVRDSSQLSGSAK